MYLTYDLSSKTLIRYSETYEGERNINFNGFVYLDNYIAIKYDDTVTSVETRFDEFTGFEEIVPGQYEIDDNDIESLRTYKARSEMFKEARNYTRDLINRENIGYYLAAGKVKSDRWGLDLLRDVALHFGINSAKVRQFVQNRYQECMQRLIYIDIAYEMFVYNNSTRTDGFDTALEEFKVNLHSEIASLNYANETSFIEIMRSN